MQKSMEQISLKHDCGSDLQFVGRLFSECSWYDEEHGMLTRQKLYVTDDNSQVYYIIRSSGEEKSHHAYKLTFDGDFCTISNGSQEITLKFDMLMHTVRGLCGLDSNATPTLNMVEEMLKAANS